MAKESIKAIVLKIGECKYFDESVDILKQQGFTDLEIQEEKALSTEEIIDKFIELQSQFNYVFVLPPLPPNVTNMIMKKMLEEKEED